MYSQQFHMSFLGGVIRRKNIPDKCVDFGYINIVQLLDGTLNLWFVGFLVNDEDQGIVILDFLHGRLSCQWEFDNGELVHTTTKGRKNQES